MVKYILTKFGADWLIFVDARVETKSDAAIFPNPRANNSRCFSLVCSIIELIQDLMGISMGEDNTIVSAYKLYRHLQ